MENAGDRFREAASIWTFRANVLVRCPRCARQAAVIDALDVSRLTCAQCALVREWDGRLHCIGEDGRPHIYSRSRHSGTWVDAETGRSGTPTDRLYGRDYLFGLELWLRSECCGGHLLWALNEEHLDWIEAYVSAQLRERSPNSPSAPSASHSQLARKLPAWLKSAKHRDEIIRNIQRMRASLDP